MCWVLSIDAGTNFATANSVSKFGQHKKLPIEALIKSGLPASKKLKKITYQGDLSQWYFSDYKCYLNAYGFDLNAQLSNQHMVYECMLERVRIVVPALVFIRAFFRPSIEVLPVLFTPASVDTLCFVDYSSSPAEVVIDDRRCRRRLSRREAGLLKQTPLEWSQMSRSARSSAQSVFMHSLSGELAIQLPRGLASVAFHGIQTVDGFFVSKASLTSIEVSKTDSIDGLPRQYFFHALADTSWQTKISMNNFEVTLHKGGGSDLTDVEWIEVARLIKGQHASGQIYSQRHLMDGVLFKLSTGTPWSKVPFKCGDLRNHKYSFRKWAMSGRLEAVLSFLKQSRGLKEI